MENLHSADEPGPHIKLGTQQEAAFLYLRSPFQPLTQPSHGSGLTAA